MIVVVMITSLEGHGIKFGYSLVLVIVIFVIVIIATVCVEYCFFFLMMISRDSKMQIWFCLLVVLVSEVLLCSEYT